MTVSVVQSNSTSAVGAVLFYLFALMAGGSGLYVVVSRDIVRTAVGLLFTEVCMFVALEMSVVVVERLVPVETKIKRCSAQLANQIQRASESVALNLAEGRWRSAGDQRRHYEMAAGSASEVTVALRIALAKRYVTKPDLAEVEGPLDQVRAMLFRLTHR